MLEWRKTVMIKRKIVKIDETFATDAAAASPNVRKAPSK